MLEVRWGFCGCVFVVAWLFFCGVVLRFCGFVVVFVVLCFCVHVFSVVSRVVVLLCFCGAGIVVFLFFRGGVFVCSPWCGCVTLGFTWWFLLCLCVFVVVFFARVRCGAVVLMCFC